jgi:pilus assembly protein CpaF
VSPYREIDHGLRSYLDLKSRLHDELLGRLNLSVLDKVERSELRREIAALVHDFIAAENRPMRATRPRR